VEQRFALLRRRLGGIDIAAHAAEQIGLVGDRALRPPQRRDAGLGVGGQALRGRRRTLAGRPGADADLREERRTGVLLQRPGLGQPGGAGLEVLIGGRRPAFQIVQGTGRRKPSTIRRAGYFRPARRSSTGRLSALP
jgi:hypothetical protein